MSTSAPQFRTADTDRRGQRQSSLPDRFCTTDVRASALNAPLRRTYFDVYTVSRDAVQLEAAEEGSALVGDNDQLMLSILSERYIEHDSFTLFGILMQTAKSFYETSPLAPPTSGNSAAGSSAIVERSRRIHEDYLNKVDPELARHITDIDVLPQIFVM